MFSATSIGTRGAAATGAVDVKYGSISIERHVSGSENVRFEVGARIGSTVGTASGVGSLDPSWRVHTDRGSISWSSFNWDSRIEAIQSDI